MNLISLEYFIAIVEAGGYSAAASTLYVAQSTLTRHIQGLEKELGYALFHRDTHTVELTEEGRLCLLYARNVLSTIEQMRQINCAGTELTGTIRIGYVSMVENLLISDIIGAIYNQYPHVQAVSIPASPAQLLSQFEQNKLDVICMPGIAAANLRGAERCVLCRQRLNVLLPKGHRLAQKKALVPADLSGETLLSFPPESAPEIFRTNMQILDQGGARLKEIVYFDSPEQIPMMVEAGKGVSLNASIGTLSAYSIDIRPLAQDVAQYDVFAFWKARNPNPILKPIARILRQIHTAQ